MCVTCLASPSCNKSAHQQTMATTVQPANPFTARRTCIQAKLANPVLPMIINCLRRATIKCTHSASKACAWHVGMPPRPTTCIAGQHAQRIKLGVCRVQPRATAHHHHDHACTFKYIKHPANPATRFPLCCCSCQLTCITAHFYSPTHPKMQWWTQQQLTHHVTWWHHHCTLDSRPRQGQPHAPPPLMLPHASPAVNFCALLLKVLPSSTTTPLTRLQQQPGTHLPVCCQAAGFIPCGRVPS
jgi:hypothetical protein